MSTTILLTFSSLFVCIPFIVSFSHWSHTNGCPYDKTTLVPSFIDMNLVIVQLASGKTYHDRGKGKKGRKNQRRKRGKKALI